MYKLKFLSTFLILCILGLSACSSPATPENQNSANLEQTIIALQNQVQELSTANNVAATAIVPTPQPTVTLRTPEDPNPSLTLPFEDDFDSGLDSAWRIDFGNPVVLDGRLTAAGDQLVIEIGNTSLNQYTIVFDVWGKDKDYCGMDYFKYVTINFSPTLQYIFNYVDYEGSGGWNNFSGNEWSRISRKNGLDCGRFKFVVADTSYQMFINGQLVDELVYTSAQGPIRISLDDSVTIDNLVIK